MHLLRAISRFSCLPAFLSCLIGMPGVAPGRQQPKTEPTVRVQVGLVQTDVMVFDRQDRFVPGLKQDQFELQIDGKLQTIAFCEQLSSGTGREDAAWTTGGSKTAGAAPPESAVSDAGRSVIFFVDDWHLSTENLIHTRAALQNLLDSTLGVSDRAGIFSASGNLGFLQQLTDNRAVLQAALQKLTFSNAPVQDKATPPMTEAQALAIEQNDDAVLSYFIDAYASSGGRRPALGRAAIEKIVRSRAAALASQSVTIAERTFVALGNVMRTFALLPGRKLCFFLSDGFVLQMQRPELITQIRQTTTAAARAGIVIYSLDTRGLIVGGPDVANPVRPDTSSRLVRSASSEVTAAWDALNAIAADTGGVFLKNTNALDSAMTRTLAETSRYYLLGWYLDREMQESGKYRSLRVTVKDRPDLKVRVRQGKLDFTRLAAQGPGGALPASPAPKDSTGALLLLLRSPFPIGLEPVALVVGYDLIPDRGLCLTIALQTSIQAAGGKAAKSEAEARIELVGLVSNQDGETVTSFSDSLIRLDSPENSAQDTSSEWRYSGVIAVKPGIYQVRVAVRDSLTGRAGSTLQWVEVPEFSISKFSAGSIVLTEEAGGNVATEAAPDPTRNAAMSIRRRFGRSSQALYIMRVYNPAGVALQAQTRIYRGNRLVRQSAFVPLQQQLPEDVGRSLARGSLPLAELEPGDYTLEILVKDSSGSPPVGQRIRFWVQ